MAARPNTKTSTRVRRPSDEVRRLLVDAAAHVFTTKGFAEATADDIAAEAGVARSAIWKHFSDKADLFGAAVLLPFVEFLESYTAAYDDQDWDDVEITKAIVGMFYDSCVAHREALAGIAVSGRELDETTLERLEQEFDRFFAEVMRTTEFEAVERGWVPTEGLGLTMRLLFGAVAAAVVFDRPLISSAESIPNRDQVIDHTARLFLYGATLDPDVSRAG
jgi:AcrR family transcriptional regulator